MGIKFAGKNELAWVNEQYRKVGFVPSSLENETIAIVAHELVDFLVKETRKNNLKEVYCLPFEKLKRSYEKFGFSEFDMDRTKLNSHVLDKFYWCQENYEKKVLLLKLS